MMAKKDQQISSRSKKNRLGEAYARAFPTLKKELPLAYNRVGDTPAKRLQWLLNFASDVDLESLSGGRLVDLQWDVVVFGLNAKPDFLHNPFGLQADVQSQRKADAIDRYWEQRAKLFKLIMPVRDKQTHTPVNLALVSADFDSSIRTGAPLETVRKFHDTMRDAFNSLFVKSSWEFTRPSTVESISLHPDLKGSSALLPNAHDLLLIQGIDLIAAEKDRLRICQNPKCKKRFVALKKTRARFCGSRCSAYVRVNKSRGKM